jgi:CHAD domain-containing protein
MDACGSVRDRDIAIGLLEKAGVPAASPLVRQLDQERRAADEELRRELRRWKARGFRRQWQMRLEL